MFTPLSLTAGPTPFASPLDAITAIKSATAKNGEITGRVHATVFGDAALDWALQGLQTARNAQRTNLGFLGGAALGVDYAEGYLRGVKAAIG